MENRILNWAASHASGVTLDIGCGRQRVRPYLGNNIVYYGLDHYVFSVTRYKHRPAIYAEGEVLPIANDKIDTVLLLEVLEHVQNPEKVLVECNRILTANGKVVISVPFLYPIHDAPYDYRRWTQHGLEQLAISNGFKIAQLEPYGSSIATASLLFSIAISKCTLELFKRKNPIGLLLFLGSLLVIPIVNIIAAALSSIVDDNPIMPTGYLVTLEVSTDKHAHI